jgi:hypothetical protein
MYCHTLGGSTRQSHPSTSDRNPSSNLALDSLRPSNITNSIVAICFVVLCQVAAIGQTPVTTHHYDNARTGQNTHELILGPANVNPAQFGKIFVQPLDGIEAGQPLYLPNIYIPSSSAIHNVVYVATQHDSVYAFDANDDKGTNASPLWYTNFLDPANGVSTVPVADEFCQSAYPEFGIQGTPVIDTERNAIYVLAMTKENGQFVHKLHALDLGTGKELFGGPVTVTASVTIDNQLYTFIDRYQQQRPALLLEGGIVYIGFGSPGCNVKTENGWVMAYDGRTLQQVGVFDASPGVMASAVWMSGGGLVGDGAGNIYANTGDGLFDVDSGGSHYGDSLLKFNQGADALNLVDYFTPSNQKFLQTHNLDVGSGGIMLLPDTPGGSFAIAIDKDGTIYLVNQDALGQYNPLGDFQIPQELETPVLGEVHGGLTYWNNNIYVAAYETPVMAYSFSNGQISPQPTSQTLKIDANPQGGIVSANGNTNGIFWYVTSPTSHLFAFDATNLANELYDSSMAGTRDSFGPVVHFEMPMVTDGRVYVNGRTQLTVFGLLPVFIVAAGNNQTGAVGTTLPIALQAALQDPYSGNPIETPGIPVTFSCSCKAGSFSDPTPTTNSEGTVSTYYTLPTKPGTYTITASSLGYASATFTVTATSSAPETLSITSGNSQKALVTSPLPLPLTVKVKDAMGNGVPGVQVSFSDGGAGGTLTPPTATTNSSGVASVSYTTGKKSGAVTISASSVGLKSVAFKETVLAGAATSLNLFSGNDQTVKAGSATPKPLQVIVEDQYSNPVPGAAVTFDDEGAGGSFSVDPATTNAKGIAKTIYTAPNHSGSVTIKASLPGVGSMLFTVNVN